MGREAKRGRGNREISRADNRKSQREKAQIRSSWSGFGSISYAFFSPTVMNDAVISYEIEE